MPKIPSREDARIERIDRAWAEFEDGFRRSRKGNLWRLWEGVTITIFERSDGYYG